MLDEDVENKPTGSMILLFILFFFLSFREQLGDIIGFSCSMAWSAFSKNRLPINIKYHRLAGGCSQFQRGLFVLPTGAVLLPGH
jgi:hypothetical protein